MTGLMQPEAKGRNVLVTGPSRSGTTLTCELLNQVADTVALDEPMNAMSLLGHRLPHPGERQLEGVTPARARVRARVSRLLRGRRPTDRPPDPTEACDNIVRFLAEARRSISERQVAVSRHVGGRVLGQKVSDDRDADGVRLKLAEFGEISVDKDLSPDFLLVIKQTSGFIALLDELVSRFEVYALVRNPLAILVSWQTLPFHPGDGHVRLGEGIDWELRDRLATIDDRIDRQFEILRWYFARINRAVDSGRIMRYEDLVDSPSRTLGAVTQRAGDLDVKMENRNRRPDSGTDEVAASLGARLLRADGPWWEHYSEDDVRALFGRMGHDRHNYPF